MLMLGRTSSARVKDPVCPRLNARTMLITSLLELCHFQPLTWALVHLHTWAGLRTCFAAVRMLNVTVNLKHPQSPPSFLCSAHIKGHRRTVFLNHVFRLSGPGGDQLVKLLWHTPNPLVQSFKGVLNGEDGYKSHSGRINPAPCFYLKLLYTERAMAVNHIRYM